MEGSLTHSLHSFSLCSTPGVSQAPAWPLKIKKSSHSELSFRSRPIIQGVEAGSFFYGPIPNYSWYLLYVDVRLDRMKSKTKDAGVIFDEGTKMSSFWAGRSDIVGYFKGFATKQMHEANTKHTQN